jgi:hypothetical protein
MASTDLVFSDEASANQALANVRSDTIETNWALFTYAEAGKNHIALVGQGSGGIEELKPHLVDSGVFYGLLRVTDKIDNSVTVKFVFIVWCGEKVPFVQKAKVTTHKGSISKLIGQYHNDLNCSNLDELSEDIIMRKVRDASGTSVHVKHNAGGGESSPASSTKTAAAPRAAASKSGGTKGPSNVPTTSVVQFVDEDSIRSAIKAVRSDNDETDWVLLGYEGTGNTTKIALLSQGSGGLDELIALLKPDQVLYGLYRTTDTVDNTVAVKFVLILWVGESVAVTRKARIVTHKGEILSLIGQYHVDCSASNLDEINDDIISSLVKKASGTAVFVK